MGKKKFLFITSTNLSCNPRCWKEVQYCLKNNTDVTLISFNLHNWTTPLEQIIRKEYTNIKFIDLDAGTKQKWLPWFFWSVCQKIASFLAKYFFPSLLMHSLGYHKRTAMILWQLIKLNQQFDWVIAHNPPAFYPAFWFSKKNKIPFGVDVEDYHPAEGSNKKEQATVSYLMQQILPKAAYISFAAPLIKTAVEKLLINSLPLPGIVINNLFPTEEFTQVANNKALTKIGGNKLQLVWFSQYVDFGRGLEDLLPCLDAYATEISLTLIGAMRNDFFEKMIAHRRYIYHIPSLAQVTLHHQLGHFDVGLALETAKADGNRLICLTNKIWSYFQAGLFILATNTQAQQLFLMEHQQHGKLMPLNNEKETSSLINWLINNKETILKDKIARLERAKNYHIDTELSQLNTIWLSF
ncbi:MAG: hypothetical protein ACOVNR_05760 [Chitinophagaceae bacterium]